MASLLSRSAADSGASTGPGKGDDRIRRRFVRRQWRRRWRVWRVALIATLVAVIGAGAVWTIYFSTLLSATQVQVQGAEFLTPQQVRGAALVPLGEPLATIDLAEIQSRVNALAPVKSAQVTRLWPDQVLIEVHEREVLAVVEIGGQFRGMDAAGVIFREFGKAPRQIPRIRTELAVDTDTLREAGQVLSALPPTVSKRVNYVRVETIDRITLVLRDGRVVLWGSAEESVDKARVLEKLLATQATTYDVSVPGLPTYRK